MLRSAGTTIDCLRQLFQSSYKEDIRYPLAEFCHTSVERVQIWKSKRANPQSEQLMGVRHFLELLGCVVDEIKQLAPVYQTLGRAVAFQVVTIEGLTHIFATTGQKQSQRDAVIAVLLGRRNLFGERLEKVTKYATTLEPDIERACKAFLLKWPALASVAPIVKETRSPTSHSTLRITPGTHAAVAPAAACIKALIPLTEYLLSRECTSADRDALHALLGDGAVLKLTRHLRDLCSETARTGNNPLTR